MCSKESPLEKDLGEAMASINPNVVGNAGQLHKTGVNGFAGIGLGPLCCYLAGRWQPMC